MKPKYPFIPKSSKLLTPGDFWAVPLRDGTFGCGRVVEHMPNGMPGARVGFLGGLLDWHGSSVPETQSIAGASFLAQGVMHILAITKTGGSILGNRPLILDSLGPLTFAYGNNIQRGFTYIRPWERADRDRFPSLSWWGYDVIEIHATRKFVERKPLHL